MNNLSPIILFVYNRPEHTQRTIESLLKCNFASDSTLYVFSDAAKNNSEKAKVDLVRNYIHSAEGFKKIIVEEAETNKGLASSVITGVSKVLLDNKSAIVLEDDLVFSVHFLEFMNEAIKAFETDKYIFSISGYSFPIKIPKSYHNDVFISHRSSSWGWATWRDRWEKADWSNSYFNEILKNKNFQKKFNRAGNDYSPMLFKQLYRRINSWAIRWAYVQMINNAYTLFPIKSLVKNIGLDGSGTHSTKRKRYVVDLEDFNPKNGIGEKLNLDEEINSRIRKLNSLSVYRRIRNFISYGIY